MTDSKQEIAEEKVPEEVITEQVEEKVETPKEPVKKEKDHNWEQANQVMRLQKQRIEELEAKINQVKPPQPPEED